MVETNLVFLLVDVLFIICPTYNYGCGRVGSLSNTHFHLMFFYFRYLLEIPSCL